MIHVREISPRRELRKFIAFPSILYHQCPQWAPPLAVVEQRTLDPRGNPAFGFCEASYLMACDGTRPVGRVIAILNRRLNEATGRRTIRFAWPDSVDEPAVCAALRGAGERFATERGMDEIHGPLGFTDFDRTGVLVEGYDEPGTIHSNYNYSYYEPHIRAAGYSPAAEWVEYEVLTPPAIPDKILRVAAVAEKRGFSTLRCRRVSRGHAAAAFRLVNDSYQGLYGFYSLTDTQIEWLLDGFLGVAQKDFYSVVLDPTGTVVGFGLSSPSMSKASKASGGCLLPFGFARLAAAAFGRNDTVDMLLVAVRPDAARRGATALIFRDLLETYLRRGIVRCEAHWQMVDNAGVRTMWRNFGHRIHKRRRCYERFFGRNPEKSTI